MGPFLPLLLFVLCEEVHAEDPDVTSNPGDDVTLPCRSAGHYITAVEWTRTDLKSEYVFLSVDGHFQPKKQHPSFQGRVQLVVRDLKDGDASLTLKNVRSSDEGTYECRVKVDNSTRQKRAILKTEPISRVRLQVTEDGAKKDGAKKDGAKKDGAKKDGAKKDGDNTGLYIGLAVAAVVFLCVVFFVCMYKRRRRLNKDPEAPPADEAERVELCDMTHSK